ncbi:MAG: hypothetical protein ACI4R9_00215, partial [Kiritimatiellia bacterium]
MKKPRQPSARYTCATIDVFNIQVVLATGDFDECCNLIEGNRNPNYRGPKISDRLRSEKKDLDEECKERTAYASFTAHIDPVVVIYAPKPIAIGAKREFAVALKYGLEVIVE